MFKVKIDDDEYKVTFIHKIPEQGQFEFPDALFKTMFGTQCNIWKNGEWQAGMATSLNPKDQYNRKFGRKLSLAKTLEAVFPNQKFTRKLFWEAYYNARGEKW